MRKNFKLIITILTVVILGVLGSLTNVFAANASLVLGLEATRKSGYAYKAFEKTIWKIASYASQDDTVANMDRTIYCLRAGIGFGSTTEMGGTTPEKRIYEKSFDMKNYNSIDEVYKTVLPSNENYIDDNYGITCNDYKSLLWVLDNVYVPAVSGASSQKVQEANSYKVDLLTRAGVIIPGEVDAEDVYLTDEDIDVIQQIAIWYFTLNPEYKAGYSDLNHVFAQAIDLIKDNVTYSLSDFNDGDRYDEAMKLLTYLITEAKANYDYAPSVNTPAVELIKDNAGYQKVNNTIYMGPFRINKLANTNYSFSCSLQDGQGNDINYTLAGKNGNTFNTLPVSNVSDLIAEGTEFYLAIDQDVVGELTFNISSSTKQTNLTYWSVDANNTNYVLANEQPVVEITRDFETYTDSKTVSIQEFDLALRKYIVSIGGTEVTTSREPNIANTEISALASQEKTTADKIHPKNALLVSHNDKIVYTIRVYNEGTMNGYVTEITDYLPEGLTMVPLSESEINTSNGWQLSADGKTAKTSSTSNTLLDAISNSAISYVDVQIECQVIAEESGTDNYLKNVAEITGHKDVYGNTTVIDRDSVPESLTSTNVANYGTTSFQDDDDYELVVLKAKAYDLALRKFIVAVNGEELLTGDRYTREPQINVNPLVTGEDTTAIYTHTKKTVEVHKGDIVTYAFKVYNEGDLDAYVATLVDYLPAGVELITGDDSVNSDFNDSYGWLIDENNTRIIRTNYLDKEHDEDNLLKAFNKTTRELDESKYVFMKCKVTDTAVVGEELTNIAEIQLLTDVEGNEVTIDRDSQVNNVQVPEDSVLPAYKGNENNNSNLSLDTEFYRGQQDDDDFEKIIIQQFDLALRKFITGVNDTPVTNREPVFSIDENGKYVYTHTKEPVEVCTNDLVTYTLRIYNEGQVPGYASLIKDDIPEGLEFVPDNIINDSYNWIMYKEVTETDEISDAQTVLRNNGKIYVQTNEVSEADVIMTDYLSKDKNPDKLINAFDSKVENATPSYVEVKAVFKVIEPTTSNRILINTAEVADDTDKNGNPIDDIDSIPDNNILEEDDIDIEKVKVKYFDLALKKWVSSTIIIDNGKETKASTGHTGDENPEPVVKVELKSKKLKSTVVKFEYTIKVTNEGEIAGYVDEIRDYVPEGLKFNAADNAKWTQKEDGTIVTDQLKDTLLQPGETASVTVIFTWINGNNNLGLKVNVAEISKDRNDSNTPDIDSTPDNKVAGEDDIDDAPVILSVKTGETMTYVYVSTAVAMILSTGIILIKKYII